MAFFRYGLFNAVHAVKIMIKSAAALYGMHPCINKIVEEHELIKKNIRSKSSGVSEKNERTISFRRCIEFQFHVRACSQ